MASYFVTSLKPNTERVISGLSILMFVILPMLLTISCYWKVYQKVKGHNATVSNTLSAGLAENNSSLTKEEIHITRSLLALVCGFVVCWIPSTTLVHLSAYVNLPRRVELIAMYTASFSSAINPILFNIFNKRFKAEFLNIFCPTNFNSGPELDA
jgi:melatonin receptor type 1B